MSRYSFQNRKAFGALEPDISVFCGIVEELNWGALILASATVTRVPWPVHWVIDRQITCMD